MSIVLHANLAFVCVKCIVRAEPNARLDKDTRRYARRYTWIGTYICIYIHTYTWAGMILLQNCCFARAVSDFLPEFGNFFHLHEQPFIAPTFRLAQTRAGWRFCVGEAENPQRRAGLSAEGREQLQRRPSLRQSALMSTTALCDRWAVTFNDLTAGWGLRRAVLL